MARSLSALMPGRSADSDDDDPAGVDDPGAASRGDETTSSVAVDLVKKVREPEGDPAPPVVDSTNGDNATDVRPRRSRWLLAMLTGVVIAVAGSIVAVDFSSANQNFRSSTARNAEVLDVARRVSTDLVTLRFSTAEADVQRIRDESTGQFLQQISDTTGSFAAVLTQGQVESTGQAREVALVSASSETATVIAAVTSTVKNSQAPEGQQRVYRMKLTLQREDGRWLASGVEFVS